MTSNTEWAHSVRFMPKSCSKWPNTELLSHLDDMSHILDFSGGTTEWCLLVEGYVTK